MIAVALAVALGFDLVAWAAFRLDKARARRQGPRLRERTLLWLAVLGGVGAWLGMYAHRQRHKSAKLRFVVVVTLSAVAQLGGLAVALTGAWP